MDGELVSRELRRLERQARLDAARGQSERNRLGQFATPPKLAMQITRFVASHWNHSKPVDFLEPAVGTGVFWGALCSVFPPDRVRSAIGIEIDREYANAARECWAATGLKVIQGDFIRTITKTLDRVRPNLILTNPPYVRHHHLSRDKKQALQRLATQTTGLPVHGLSGLYVYFFLLASECLQEDGLGAWLIPSEFLDVNYGEVLRRYLTEKVTLLRIHRFDPKETQFEDALVSSAVVVVRKRAPSVTDIVEFSTGGSLQQPAVLRELGNGPLRSVRRWTPVFDGASLPSHCAKIQEEPTLSDFFKIQRGIATGCDKFFIMPRAEAQRLKLPAQFLRPILPSPRRLTDAIVEANSDGFPKLSSPLAIIDCELPEATVEGRFPCLWQYLRRAEAEGIRDRYLLRKRSPWYRLEVREPAPFLCTYMGRGTGDRKPLRFIWNQSRAIVTNLYLMLYPKGRLAELLRTRPSAAEDVYRFLCSVTADQLRTASRVYGGALHKLEPSELAALPALALLDRVPELAGRTRQEIMFA